MEWMALLKDLSTKFVVIEIIGIFSGDGESKTSAACSNLNAGSGSCRSGPRSGNVIA